MRKLILLVVCAAVFVFGWIVHKRAADFQPAQNQPTVAGDAKVQSIDVNAMQVGKSDDSQARIDAKRVLKPEASTLYVWVAGTKEESKHLPGVPKSSAEEPIDINAIQIVKPEDSHLSPGSETVMWSSGDDLSTVVFKGLKEK